MLGILPNAVFTSHLGQSGGRGLSPRLWSKANGQALSPDGASNGFYIADDFLSFGGTLTSTAGTYFGQGGAYLSYQTNASDTIAQTATDYGGVIRLLGTNADEDEVYLQSGYATGAFGKISPTAGSNKLTIFEARFRVGQVANTSYNVFLGLAEPGCMATGFIGAEGVLADKDLIGFQVIQSDGDALRFVCQNEGDAVAISVPIASVSALAADTWYKVGFVYDPTAPASARIKVYCNNAEHGTKITATDMAAATFPDKLLSFIAGLQIEGTDDKTLDLDWWAFYQSA